MARKSAHPRKQISTRTRFEIFKRDGFVCQYCGAHPPNAILHVDHVIPVAEGGRSEPENYVTACETCNMGKGPVSLSAVPISLADRAAIIAESEAQLRGYVEVTEAQRRRKTEEAWEIIHVLNEKTDEVRRDWLISIKRFIEKLGFTVVAEAMDLARARKPFNDKHAFLYFCGICHNKIRDLAD